MKALGNFINGGFVPPSGKALVSRNPAADGAVVFETGYTVLTYHRLVYLLTFAIIYLECVASNEPRLVLARPEMRGRIAYYGADHVGRLQLIARLQDRGFSLAAIRALIETWETGGSLEDLLNT